MLEGIWEDLHLKFGGRLEIIKYYMNLHIKTGVIPDIVKDSQQGLLKLGKHQDI